MKPAIKAIYDRMPPEDRARVDPLSEPFKSDLVELWSHVKRDGESGEELQAMNRERDNERSLASALSGKCGDRARAVVQARVSACPRVTGKTMEALKRHDREHYRRFLAGCSRAIKREAAIASGDLSAFELSELRRRYNLQRDVDRYAEEFPDFQDYGEAVSP